MRPKAFLEQPKEAAVAKLPFLRVYILLVNRGKALLFGTYEEVEERMIVNISGIYELSTIVLWGDISTVVDTG